MYWKCTVCGYIHKAAEPPESCPVCGAARNRFILVDADGLPLETAPGDHRPAPLPESMAGQESAPRYWKCTVCGYIHRGDQPPEKCPVCGADRLLFVEVGADGAPGSKTTTSPPSDPISDDPGHGLNKEPARPQRWKCSVCGYIHTGTEPPTTCPACGADRRLFSPLPPDASPTPESTPSAAPPPQQAATPARRYYDLIADLMVKQHAHPISVHIPNGVAPVAMLFLFLSVMFRSTSLEVAAACNMAVVLLAMPVVIFSGINDWQKRFGGNMTSLFLTKMVCAGIVSAVSLILVFWRMADPSVAFTAGTARTLYLLLHCVLVSAAAVAGFMGGKLVFRNH